MSFHLSVIGSVLLHGAAFFLIAAHPAFQRAVLPSVATDRWIMDVSTVLLSDSPGTEPPPQEPPVTSPSKEAKVPFSAEAHPDIQALRDEPEPVIKEYNPKLDDTSGTADSYSPQMVPSTSDKTATLISRAFANTMNAQTIVANLMQYRRTAVAHLKGGLGQVLPLEDRWALDQATGTVVISFQDDTIASLAVESDNDKLRSLLLEQVNWHLLPAPRHYSLPISRVACMVSVSNGKIRVGVGPI